MPGVNLKLEDKVLDTMIGFLTLKVGEILTLQLKDESMKFKDRIVGMPTSCPKCHSSHISGEDIVPVGDSGTQEVECKCGFQWTEIWNCTQWFPKGKPDEIHKV